MYTLVLLPLDGSELAEQAVPHAEAIASRFDAKLMLVQVIKSFTAGLRETLPREGLGLSPGAEVSVEIARQQVEADLAEARTYLEKVRGGLAEKGLDVEYELFEGTPGSAIVEYANDRGVSLIVMATRGRGALSKLVFGSVADEVIRSSGVPVLVVRPRDE